MALAILDLHRKHATKRHGQTINNQGASMAKADLHVHSKYSDHPSTWGHKVYNSPESFTEIETVYTQAKTRGMDFVTLTDHDDIRGSLELVRKYPSDCFISCEVTSYFPEDDCKCHILVYGITEQQYDDLMLVAASVYALRDYIANNNIAYSVAHACYDQDGLLSFHHIEKLVLLFDVFEVINGACGEQSNRLLHTYLHKLTPDKLRGLENKHSIKPISNDPWIKGFTGGADDHCGILIGSAYTHSDTTTIDQFLQSIRDKHSLASGMHGSFEAFATGIIKHVHDYRANRDSKYSKTKMSDFLQLFFEGEQGNLVKRFRKSQSLRYLKKKNTKTHKALAQLLEQIEADVNAEMSEKIPNAYIAISELHDEMFRSVITVFSKHLPSGDIFKGFNRLSSIFPMSLLVVPFIAAMRHQMLKPEIKAELIKQSREPNTEAYSKKTLWFTDTIDDLNGVSVTLRQIAKQASAQNYNLKLVTSVEQAKLITPPPEGTINFTPVKEITVPGYETQKIGFPSLLSLLQHFIAEQPDQVIISTPGPLGLGAMLCAKLLGLPVKTVYHTDFAEQVMRMTNEPSLATIINVSVNQFYRQADEVFVPSQFYINKLAREGLSRKALSIFPRGIDLDLYRPAAPQINERKNETVIDKHRDKLKGSFTLLFAGRISEDKNLSMLKAIIKLASQQEIDCYNFVVAGDGPDLGSLKNDLASFNNVFFTNRLQPEQMVDWYQACDLLIFPSHTDTFGMVVLEAQACGLPCIVSNTGGPKEIIANDQTGQVIYRDDANDWLATIEYYQTIKSTSPEKWKEISQKCSELVHQKNSWKPFFDSVLGDSCQFSPDKDETLEQNATSVSLANQQSTEPQAA